MEKRLLKDVHTTHDDGHDDNGGFEEEDLSEPRSEEFSSRRLSATAATTADLDFVQAKSARTHLLRCPILTERTSIDGYTSCLHVGDKAVAKPIKGAAATATHR